MTPSTAASRVLHYIEGGGTINREGINTGSMCASPSENQREDVIFLTIMPSFAEKIYKEEKKYEFRKPPIPDNLRYVILIENGERKITGGFSVAGVHERSIDELWEEFGKKISDYDRFHKYFENRNTGVAIEVKEAKRITDSISVQDLEKQDEEFNIPPQIQFVYATNDILRFLGQYSDKIEDLVPDTEPATLDEWETEEQSDEDLLSVRLIQEDEEQVFRDLFSESPVPKEYEDIDEGFLDHIVESHRRGEDPYGYFTLKKQIHTYLHQGEIAGFTVTTWKRGGSVKYGPTILKEEYRDQGYGPQFRRLLDDDLATQGVRKVYSTIPEHRKDAFSYLIKSGYNVEAHLKCQYSEEHDELVFGKLLEANKPSNKYAYDRQEISRLGIENSTEYFDNFSDFVIQEAAHWYNEIDNQFIENVINAEERDLDSDYSKKAKKVFIGHKSDDIKCTAIASLKRGRSIKISPVLTTVVGESFDSFIKTVEDELLNINRVRKFYTHVPVNDSELVYKFETHGYQSEGILLEPYKEGVNMLVLGKMVET